jgi:hypothetical protein
MNEGRRIDSSMKTTERKLHYRPVQDNQGNYVLGTKNVRGREGRILDQLLTCKDDQQRTTTQANTDFSF